ncbi:type I phosphomannose isomerase catalytic subunit [[Mycoplasma] collis]|uniref:type I phosphomannose isomerase catalytic subunit n=1 Tax=[Mycoplasma] collis TaxID=2127 RepID=UPI00051B5C07|nr:type I phosphomannose isomerase catalytic subunit [[Mycoplasma] collis]
MDKIIFLKPFLKQVLWAGNKLEKMFNSKEKQIGEAWLISAINNFESTIINEKYKDIKLNVFFNENKEFFSNYQGQYPNLTKFIDAKDKLSLQVHPDDKMAKKHNSLGKDECWYVLDTQAQRFILGLKKAKKSVILNELKQNNIQNWLKYKKLKNDDFIYIKAGLVHAIPENTMVYELQQSSDITYRIYDYDRLDLNENKRELHIEEAKKAIKNSLKTKIINNQNELVKNKYFNLNKIFIEKEKIIYLNNFKWVEIVVIDGFGTVNEHKITKGSAFLVSGLLESFVVKGNLTILINYVK